MRIEITVENAEQGAVLIGVLLNAEENGDINFPFNVRTEDV